jgi:hypothetical protein
MPRVLANAAAQNMHNYFDHLPLLSRIIAFEIPNEEDWVSSTPLVTEPAARVGNVATALA